MKHPISEILANRKNGSVKGVISLCTASPLVIETSMQHYKKVLSPLIIEATANQVNQDGGYTNMTPQDYADFVIGLAHKNGFPLNRLILGGDHLGPLVWSDLDEATAMAKSEVLIEAFVLAGFTKIHVDTSMKLGSDDKNQILTTSVIAARGIRLIKVAEAAYQTLLKTNPKALAPVYIIGSEVPIPGGAQEEETLQVTTPQAFSETVEIYQDDLKKAGLDHLWPRIVAVVVQPGVEFGDTSVHEYDRQAAAHLIESLKPFSPLVFEGHSTDYQTRHHLKAMVDDGIAILKVGPALTFALREGLFALSAIENELIDDVTMRSNLRAVLEESMLAKPKNWRKHYHGTDHDLAFARKFSYSDRSRYYMFEPEVTQAIERLFENTTSIPLSLLSQYMPIQYRKVREGQLSADSRTLASDWVNECLNDYLFACEN